jgi:hypothetical protein
MIRHSKDSVPFAKNVLQRLACVVLSTSIALALRFSAPPLRAREMESPREPLLPAASTTARAKRTLETPMMTVGPLATTVRFSPTSM